MLWRRILETGGLSGFEVASVANLQPESVEEAKTLIPSLDVRAFLLGTWNKKQFVFRSRAGTL